MVGLIAVVSGQAFSESKLALGDIFFHAARGWKFFQWLKIFDGETLLGKATSEESSGGASVAIHKRTDGHELEPKTCACMDESWSRGIAIKNSVKIT